MRIRFFLTMMAATLVAGCATRLDFAKVGVTPEQVTADKEACWHHVLNTPEGQSAANSINGARALGTFIGGGVIAAMTTVALDAMQEDPKKNPGNERVHVECMQGKGYTPEMVAM